ncbi:MAG: hypothetical protein KJZ69_04470 [Phycisphaerales bacterium]|nr:hypothetical protein [Phycisphaerales bacterium]
MSDECSERSDDDAIEPPPRANEAPLRPTCPGCGYDLAGTLERQPQRCPECGRAWTLDELALQHLARRGSDEATARLVTIIGPGLTAGLLLLIGLFLGSPVNWLAWPVAGAVVVFALAEWATDAYRRSFARARGRANRIWYILVRTAALLLLNAAVVGVAGLALLAAIVACERGGGG